MKKRSQLCTIEWKVLWQHSIIIQLWFLFALAATMWSKILWSRIGVFMSLWLCIFRFILKRINILWNWKLVLKIDFIFRQPLCGTGHSCVWHLRSVRHKIKSPCLELATQLVMKVVCCQKRLSSKTHKTFYLSFFVTKSNPNPRSIQMRFLKDSDPIMVV